MRKCNVCGKRFRLLAKNRYEVMDSPAGILLTKNTVYYNAFDCPHCGCQNIIGVVEKAIIRDFKNESTEKLQKIEKIIKRPEGFSQEEKAYNNMIKVADIREVLEE